MIKKASYGMIWNMKKREPDKFFNVILNSIPNSGD